MSKPKDQFLFDVGSFNPFLELYFMGRDVPKSMLNLTIREKGKMIDVQSRDLIYEEFKKSLTDDTQKEYINKVVKLTSHLYGKNSIFPEIDLDESVDITDFLFMKHIKTFDNNKLEESIIALKDVSTPYVFHIIKFITRKKEQPVQQETERLIYLHLSDHLDEIRKLRRM